jgi:hypothetical protein
LKKGTNYRKHWISMAITKVDTMNQKHVQSCQKHSQWLTLWTKIYPYEVLVSIRYGMATNKFVVLPLHVTTYIMARLFQLHISLIEKITHGHINNIYAHYTTNLLPNDLNFTVPCLARSLCMFKKPLVLNSKFKSKIKVNILPLMITLISMWQKSKWMYPFFNHALESSVGSFEHQETSQCSFYIVHDESCYVCFGSLCMLVMMTLCFQCINRPPNTI